jgi:hypothetical protein
MDLQSWNFSQNERPPLRRPQAVGKVSTAITLTMYRIFQNRRRIRSRPPKAKDSGFRAFNAETQSYPNAGEAQKVLYPGDTPPRGFDLLGEFDVSNSTFIPMQDGIYTLFASVEFDPDLTSLPSTFEILLFITINGFSRIFDSETITFVSNPSSIIGTGIISVSGIRQLNAGDRVEVFFASNVSGTINNLADATHFEASRLPSPLENSNPAIFDTAEFRSNPLNRKK